LARGTRPVPVGPSLPGTDTSERTIAKDAPGELGYRRLRAAPGEPHRARHELVEGRAGDGGVDAGQLVRLIHITDFQLADLASPSRVEFLQRLAGVPEWRWMLPAYRPQEFMLTQAVEAVVRTVRRAAEAGSAPVDFVVTTGDNTDSAQANELDRYLSLMDGGRVDPGSGNADLADTVTCSGDPAYWNPEPWSRDQWKEQHGYPDHPGAVQASAQPFTAAGLGVPWLACFGNHDCLIQGRAEAPANYEAFLVGDRKPVSCPVDRDPGGDALDEYCRDPFWVSSGPSIPIEPRTDRRMLSKKEYVERHFEAAGAPAGHGFTAENREEGTAYYAYDGVPGLRVIVLDTTNPSGHVNGCIDETQYRWLEGRLQDVHSSHLAEDGSDVQRGNDDRLVLLCSHHGLSTMTNGTQRRDGQPLYLAAEVEALLHRYPNVVLWLSGHTHTNRVTARGRAGGGGFWEVSSSSIAEWPVQLRTVSLHVVDGVGVRIRTTMVDSAVPISPSGGTSLADLAALHREAAANDPHCVSGLHAEGSPEDRNTDLVVPLSPVVVRTIETAMRKTQDGAVLPRRGA
jgi:metallophosphoesterase (TIGR03767 family)